MISFNRDVETFPLLKYVMKNCPYKSITDAGVNMAGYCIIDDEVCRNAAYEEIKRRINNKL
jgi:uncharacterized protein (UPF0371 family)